ncbi:effector binding domain-containing protein [Vagococcus fluvialis]|jgi:predicted transcriptional regulator YdeE|uniref:GyrI-like domain-containing protein n=1 Tax=Vagococcus fluvialis TaxID=2738 RepID=UPI003797E757
MSYQHKEGFQLIGRSIFIEGNTVHEEYYTGKKTEFYTQLFKEGLLKNLMPISVDKKGYALIVPMEKGIQYYAGVISEESPSGYETFNVSTEDYAVTSAKGDMSRLLFDLLEDRYFSKEETTYNGGVILEVLLNGNPMDAEVELWVPIKRD